VKTTVCAHERQTCLSLLAHLCRRDALDSVLAAVVGDRVARTEYFVRIAIMFGGKNASV
jgi:hypothetical protein